MLYIISIKFSGKVLNGNFEAAQLLAQAVHRNVNNISPVDVACDVDVDTSDCGIWIDPIGLYNFLYLILQNRCIHFQN